MCEPLYYYPVLQEKFILCMVAPTHFVFLNFGNYIEDSARQ